MKYFAFTVVCLHFCLTAFAYDYRWESYQPPPQCPAGMESRHDRCVRLEGFDRSERSPERWHGQPERSLDREPSRQTDRRIDRLKRQRFESPQFQSDVARQIPPARAEAIQILARAVRAAPRSSRIGSVFGNVSRAPIRLGEEETCLDGQPSANGRAVAGDPAAYARGGAINVCSPPSANTIIHEATHLSGLYDECETERTTKLIYYHAGLPLVGNPIDNNCDFRDRRSGDWWWAHILDPR